MARKFLRYKGKLCIQYQGVRIYVLSRILNGTKIWIAYYGSPAVDGHAAPKLLSAIKGWFHMYKIQVEQ